MNNIFLLDGITIKLDSVSMINRDGGFAVVDGVMIKMGDSVLYSLARQMEVYVRQDGVQRQSSMQNFFRTSRALDFIAAHFGYLKRVEVAKNGSDSE